MTNSLQHLNTISRAIFTAVHQLIMIEENISLQAFNTFSIKASARYFSRFKAEAELLALLEEKNFRRPV